MMTTMPEHWKTDVATGNPDVIHITPVFSGPSKPHELNGKPCWCRMRCYIPCPECDPVTINFDCWRCKGEQWIESFPIPHGRLIIYHEATNGMDDPSGS